MFNPVWEANVKNPEQTLGKFIDRQSTAFIGSLDADGFPNIKAMLAPRQRGGLRVFYFTTNASSLRVRQYRHNPQACVYFCDRRFFRGVMFRGGMEVLEDLESKSAIWREGDTLYYPLGLLDPDYCVLRFTAESGRFYSKFRSEDFALA